MYVPFIMNQVDHHIVANLNDDTVFKPNLKGMMIGNGVTNFNFDSANAYLEMAYWHSLYDTETYDAIKRMKCDFSKDFTTQACLDEYTKFSHDVEKVNVYDIFGYCFGLPSEDGSHKNIAQPHERGLVSIGGKIKSYKKVATAMDYTPWIYDKHR